jgi:ribosomal protein S18 acetylase RimI-like enzyme
MANPPGPPPLCFPAARSDALAADAGLRARGVALRAAGAHDRDWLCALYRRQRAAEFAGLDWPPPALAAFLDQQFALQHSHYVRHYAAADFLAVERQGEPLGRLYLLREAPEHLLVDISLFAHACGQGLGSALIRCAQARAGDEGCGLRLHVEHDNPAAQRLYGRLGFELIESLPTHARMRWRPSAQLKTAW